MVYKCARLMVGRHLDAAAAATMDTGGDGAHGVGGESAQSVADLAVASRAVTQARAELLRINGRVAELTSMYSLPDAEAVGTTLDDYLDADVQQVDELKLSIEELLHKQARALLLDFVTCPPHNYWVALAHTQEHRSDKKRAVLDAALKWSDGVGRHAGRTRPAAVAGGKGEGEGEGEGVGRAESVEQAVRSADVNADEVCMHVYPMAWPCLSPAYYMWKVLSDSRELKQAASKRLAAVQERHAELLLQQQQVSDGLRQACRNPHPRPRPDLRPSPNRSHLYCRSSPPGTSCSRRASSARSWPRRVCTPPTSRWSSSPLRRRRRRRRSAPYAGRRSCARTSRRKRRAAATH